MKTFLEITQQIAKQPWSIEDPDITTIKTLLEDSPKLINATQKANSFIFRTYDFSFKCRAKIINTIQGQRLYDAPQGNIKEVFCQGNTQELTYDPYLYKLREYEGRPAKYTLDCVDTENKLILHPTPDAVYNLTARYDTLKTAKRIVDNAYQEIDNLELDDDVLNVPEQYEDMYLQALYAKTMVYLIEDNTDENYVPYETSFQEALNVLLKNSSGISGETRFVL